MEDYLPTILGTAAILLTLAGSAASYLLKQLLTDVKKMVKEVGVIQYQLEDIQQDVDDMGSKVAEILVTASLNKQTIAVIEREISHIEKHLSRLDDHDEESKKWVSTLRERHHDLANKIVTHDMVREYINSAMRK